MDVLSYADMGTIKSFPMTGSPLFTFPQKLIPLDTNDGLFLLILSQNYFPINRPTGHAQSDLLTDMPSPSLTDLRLPDVKTIHICPLIMLPSGCAFSTSPIPQLFFISFKDPSPSQALHSPLGEIQFAHNSIEKWHLEPKVILYKLSTFIHQKRRYLGKSQSKEPSASQGASLARTMEIAK